MSEFTRPEAAKEASVESEGRAAAVRAREVNQPDLAATLERLVDELANRGGTAEVARRTESDRQRDEWTSVVAHDLRQPLNNLNLWLGVLERQATRAGCNLSDGFQHAHAGVKQLDRMISDLVEVSRLEANRLSLRRAPTDLPALVRRVLARAEPNVRERTHFEPREPAAPVHVDAGRLEQVLTNLLASAAKYAAPGTPLVIEVTEEEAGVRVAVQSHGPSLSEEEAERLFHRCDRGTGTTAGEVSGMGLGLYIARTLVEAHGSKLCVDSAPGQTTAFHFTLPRAP
jgi:signal transduction histidine kinase